MVPGVVESLKVWGEGVERGGGCDVMWDMGYGIWDIVICDIVICDMF